MPALLAGPLGGRVHGRSCRPVRLSVEDASVPSERMRGRRRVGASAGGSCRRRRARRRIGASASRSRRSRVATPCRDAGGTKRPRRRCRSRGCAAAPPACACPARSTNPASSRTPCSNGSCPDSSESVRWKQLRGVGVGALEDDGIAARARRAATTVTLRISVTRAQQDDSGNVARRLVLPAVRRRRSGRSVPGAAATRGRTTSRSPLRRRRR